MQEAIVIALGGSLLSGKELAELESWKSQFVNLIDSLVNMNLKLVIVVGGGKLARENINQARIKGILDTFELDLIGIEATRENAKEILTFFSNSDIKTNFQIPETIEQGLICIDEKDIILMGGTTPGHTTDAVAISMGKELNSKMVIIATNVTHVFTSDPRIDSNAKPIERMSLRDLGDLSGIGKEIQPGSSFAVDPVGVNIAIENNLPLVILNGHDVDNMRKAICGESFDGTEVYGVEN